MSNDFLIPIIIGAIFHYIIMGFIIWVATSNSKKTKYMEAQIELLMRIASQVPMGKDESNSFRSDLNRSV